MFKNKTKKLVYVYHILLIIRPRVEARIVLRPRSNEEPLLFYDCGLCGEGRFFNCQKYPLSITVSVYSPHK